MYFDIVDGVVFGKLREKFNENRGKIASFHLKDILNKEHAEREGVAIVQSISVLLSDFHENNPRGRGQVGEQNQSYINVRDGVVILRDKYWSSNQIEAFKNIVRSLAVLHAWKVE